MGCSNSSVSVVQPVTPQPLQVVTPADNPSFCLRIPGRGELQFAVKLAAGRLQTRWPEEGLCQSNPQEGSIEVAVETKKELLGIGTMNLTDSLLPPGLGLLSAGSILQHPAAGPSNIPVTQECSASQLGHTRPDDAVLSREPPANQIVSGTALLEDSAPLAVVKDGQQQEYRFPQQSSIFSENKKAGLSPIRIKHLKPRMSARNIAHNEASDASQSRSRHHSNALDADPFSPKISPRLREASTNPNILSRLRKLSDGLKPDEMNFSERESATASRVRLASSVRKPSEDSSHRILLGPQKKQRGLSFSIASRATPDRRNSSKLRGRDEMIVEKQARSELVDPETQAATFRVSVSIGTPSAGEARQSELTGHQGASSTSREADPQESKRLLASRYSQSAISANPLKNVGTSDKLLEIKVLQKSKFSQFTSHQSKLSNRLEPLSLKSHRQPAKPSSWPQAQTTNNEQPLDNRVNSLRGATRDAASSSKSVSSHGSSHSRKEGSEEKSIANAAPQDPKVSLATARIEASAPETLGIRKTDTSFHKKMLFKLTNKPQQTVRPPQAPPQLRRDAYSEASDSAEENKLPTFSIKPLDCRPARENYSQLSASSDEHLL